jgi:hypothetical protein
MDAYSQGVQGSPFVPTEAGTDDGDPVTRVPARPAFYFKAHRARWAVQGGKVLPVLGKIVLRGGVNNVTRDAAGNWRTGAAKSKAAERGWRIIPHDCVPQAHGVESYLYQPTGRPDVHLCYTDRCYPGDTRVDTDEGMWVEFLEHLVASGAIEPCPPYVLSRMLEDARKRLVSAQEDARTVPSRQADARRIADEVATIEAGLAVAQGKPNKPSKRRKVSVKEAE